MRLLVVALCLCAVLFASSAAFAQTDWAVPPPFTVQRDIAWNLVPGTTLLEPTYYGPDDPYLKDSDFIRYDNVSVFGDWIGVDNANGQVETTGSILFHIDNWKRDWPEKLIWLQTDGLEANGGLIFLGITDPAGNNVPWTTEYQQQDPTGVGFTQVLSAQIQPNPASEDFLFTFDAPAGTEAGIRNLRIATACVPEPGTGMLVLAGLGTIGALLRRWK